MRKMVMGALLVAGVISLGYRGAASADVTGDNSTEVRVFVLDKTGKPVDLKNWTGAIDVTPENGKRKAFRLEPVGPKSAEGLKEGVKEGAREAKESMKGEGQSPMVCGQVKQLDDWYVELAVIRPNMGKKSSDTAPGAEGKQQPGYKDEGKQQPGYKDEGKHEGKTWGEGGFSHTHDGGYFKATLDDASVTDPKHHVINFDATIVFTMPNGDTKYVKGFEYPEGVVEDVLGRILDKDLKETSKLDHDTAARTSRKIQAVLHSLPPLSFESDGDRQEFEKAKQECMAACHRMEQATGKDIGDAADKCKSALKEVRSQAKDAQGALTAD
jgi:hypothetical protein